jgi:hypothetical protein
MFLTTIIGTKLAAVLASAVIAGGTLTGVGVAANNAAPGDGLYGLDCAMESVGLGDGGLQERIQEATKLVEKGEIDKGLNHAAQAIQNQAGQDGNGQAGELVAAANAVQNALQTANQGESDQIRAQVAEMLQWMATSLAQGNASQTMTQGDQVGQGVTERAREICGVADQIQTQSQLRTQTQDQTQTQTQDQTQSGSTDQSQGGQGRKGGK